MAGAVYFDGLTEAIDLPLRLNIYHDEFEYIKNDSIYTFGTPNRIDRISLGGEVFTYLDGSGNSDLSGFVKMWGSQFPAIVTKMSMGLSPSATVRDRPNGLTIPPRFEREPDEHYLMKSENEAVRIISVKHLIYLLSYYSPELEKFAKKEKLSSASGADLAWLLKYYQTAENQLTDNLTPSFE